MKVSLTRSRSMGCPQCGNALRAVNIAGIEIDACPACEGAWFDQREVETFLRNRRALPSYVPAEARLWSASVRSCPVCGNRMQTLLANSVFPFDIDMCPKDEGYWFDRGELDEVLSISAGKALKLKPVDASSDELGLNEGVRRQVARIEEGAPLRRHPEEVVPDFSPVSFFDLPPSKKLLAFLGLPVESGSLYEARSTMNLLIMFGNVAVFAFMMYMSGSYRGLWGDFPEDWYMRFGLVPQRFSAAPLASAHTLLTSMFIHGGIVHLLGNMFFLFTAGDDVERRIGHVPYLMFYLLAGVVADLISMLSGCGPAVPHVGASGAISGVMGAYLALCPHKNFYLWAFRVLLFGRLIAVSAWLYLVFWFGTQVLSLRFGNPGIDYWAHIGGFAFGYVAGKIVHSAQGFNARTGQWEWCWRTIGSRA